VADDADLFGLCDRVAVVTGGGQGLGRAIAEAFAAVGARVAVLDIDPELADDVATSLPTEALGLAVDVRRKGDLDDAVSEVARRLGPVRSWVNNVGGMAGAVPGPTIDVGHDDIERILELNLTATILSCQAALQAILGTGDGGSIVNICSLQGVQAAPQLAAYGAAKAGVVQLTRTLALEHARDGVRVNAVAPSFVETPASAAMVTPERRAASEAAIPLGFISKPADIAGTVLALASDLTRFVTGQVVVADGGLSLTTARPHRGA
jgi:NAD(P)-dependent dehydrogenase (short-subunit alcohol dehydrogenase family)